MTLSTKPLSLPTEVSFMSPEDLNLAVKDNSALEKRVVSIQGAYYTIDVTKAMQQLAQVGKLIQLAYAGGQGLSCAKSIMRILGNYQKLIKNSSLASTSFVEGCLSALQNHSYALQVAEKKIDKALQFMSGCEELAAQMAKVAGDLASEADGLCKLSQEALENAIDDDRISREQKAEVERVLNEIKAREAGLQSKLKDLGNQIAEAKEAEAKAAKEADKAADRALLLSIVSAGMNMFGSMAKAAAPVVAMAAGVPAPIAAGMAAQGGPEAPNSGAAAASDGTSTSAADVASSLSVKAIQMQREYEIAKEKLDKKRAESPEAKEEIEKLEKELAEKLTLKGAAEAAFKGVMDRLDKQQQTALDKEAKAAEMRFALQKEQREANAEVAESIVKLQGFSVESNKVGKIIASLEITIKMLGRIKTVFENARIYWEGVRKHCNSLADISRMKILADPDLISKFIAAINQSAFSWLALGRINLIASDAIKKVDKGVDNIMNDLPGEVEAIQLIKTLSVQLLEQINQENAVLASSTS